MTAIQQFWHYYKQADTIASISHPFVRELIEECIENQKEFYDFAPLEHLRYLMKQDKTKIKVTDLGAGSRVDKGTERVIANIAKNAVSPKWQCQFLFQLINWLQPQNRLEIGTSLGINTLYQYLPLRAAPFYTLEGCPNIAAMAEQNFKKLKAKNIHLQIGDFAETLPQVLQKIERLDYVFIDGNHQKEPTISYFNQCLAYSHTNTIFVLDDIHWSEEMQAAWQEIQKHPKVTLSLDLFYLGIIFLKEELPKKEHFNIIPTKFKPWKAKFL